MGNMNDQSDGGFTPAGIESEAASGTGNLESSGTGTGEGSGADSGEGGGTGTGRPKRYKIYDRIASNVSLSTINIIIYVVAALLIFFIIYGIVTGNPQA